MPRLFALRVLIFEPYPVRHVYGNLRTLLYLLQAAPAHGISCFVVAPYESEVADRARRLGAHWFVMPPSIPLKYGGRLLRDSLWQRLVAVWSIVLYTRQLRRKIVEWGIEVVYCNSIRALLTIGPAAWLADVPCVWYVKGTLEHPWLDRIGFLLASRILFFCASNRDDRYPWMVRWCRRKISIVPIGLDLAETDRVSALPTPITLAPLSIGYVGQLYAPKGVHVLIEAFAQVAQEFPTAQLYLIGDSCIPEHASYVAQLRFQVRMLGLEDRVVFLGWRDDALAIMRQLTIVVHPSFAEGFGRSVLEAMALSRPVIATKVGGLREAIRDGQNGFLVPPGDVKELRACLRWLLANPKTCARLGIAARATVERDYQLADKLDTLFTIWHQVTRWPR